MTQVWEWMKANPKKAIIIAAVFVGLLLAAFGAGRFLSPTKVIETVKVVERLVVDEKVIEQRIASAKTEWEKQVQDHTKVVTKYVEGKVIERIEYRDREITSSGGTVQTKVEYVDREKIVYQEKVVEKEKIVERDCPRVTLAATVGAGFSAGVVSSPSYGMEATGRVLGPMVVGAGAEGNATGGSARVLVGITF